jgi:Domain of unknown function (DUF5615)
MPGLLADVNVQGHLPYLKRLIDGLGLLDLLVELGLTLATFPDLGLDDHMNDRELWNYCQANGWVLFTDNRNYENENSLEATIRDSWRDGCLPVITLANKGKFENSAGYATKVAEEVADVLVTVFLDEIRDQPRIFVPR